MTDDRNDRRKRREISSRSSIFEPEKGILGYGWTPENRLVRAALEAHASNAEIPKLSANDYEVVIKDLMTHIESLNEQAWRDQGTGCLNRHAFDLEMKDIIKPRLAAAIKTAEKSGTTTLLDNKDDVPVTVAVLDLNYLKSLNNFSMVNGGDVALKYMSDFFLKSLRKDEQGRNIDTLARTGGG